jgi:hypothetical protein
MTQPTQIFVSKQVILHSTNPDLEPPVTLNTGHSASDVSEQTISIASGDTPIFLSRKMAAALYQQLGDLLNA